MESYALNKDTVSDAYDRIKANVISTPIRRLHWLEKLVGFPVYAKFENMQHTGSFKYRGAFNAISKISTTKTIITASAGNHGLAIASVSSKLGYTANICVPYNSSRIKREKIIATGVSIIECGSSVEEAIEYAKELAKENDWVFISPYNDSDVINGNGSVICEIFNEGIQFENIIVPMGGGGLISGISIGIIQAQKKIKVFGCEAKNYAGIDYALKNKASNFSHSISFADGLSVKVEDTSLTIPIIKSNKLENILIDEEDLAASTFSLLKYESTLVEPSGAITIAALLQLKENSLIHGPVMLLLTGGNVQLNNLSRILQYPFSKDKWFDILELKGKSALREVTLKSYAKDFLPTNIKTSTSIKNDFNEVIHNINKRIGEITNKISDYKEYCVQYELLYNNSLLDRLIFILSTIDLGNIDIGGTFSPEDYYLTEQKIRFALKTLGFVAYAVEWCAPAYSQSLIPQLFDLVALDNPQANYERYDFADVKKLELYFLELLSFSPEIFSSVIVSSGMSAYTIIEAYLLRYKLNIGDIILVSDYIYFEAYEQLSSLDKFFKIEKLKDYSVTNIIESIREFKPKVLFIDPLTNNVNQRLCDIEALLVELKKLKMESITIVIDGTMITGGISPSILKSTSQIEIIYYESASKYLQFGFEICLAGIIISSNKLKPVLERLRRNTGGILYRPNVLSFPIASRDILLDRMLNMTNNAKVFLDVLKKSDLIKENIEYFFAGDQSHKDYNISHKFPYQGGCITFKFKEIGKNNNHNLKSIISNIIIASKKHQLLISDGVSFGYNFPRISAASSLAESDIPFLRLYIGCLDSAESIKLGEVIKSVFEKFITNENI